MLPLLLPRTIVPASSVLHLASLLGAATHDKRPHGGRVEYKVQQRALELVGGLLTIGALGSDASAALEVHWGVYARGLEYGVLRCGVVLLLLIGRQADRCRKRDSTARLLLLVTRRHHVQLYRIQQLSVPSFRSHNKPPN